MCVFVLLLLTYEYNDLYCYKKKTILLIENNIAIVLFVKTSNKGKEKN